MCGVYACMHACVCARACVRVCVCSVNIFMLQERSMHYRKHIIHLLTLDFEFKFTTIQII